MTLRKTFNFEFGTLAQRQGFAYLRTVPLRRLSYLLLAVFCVFGIVGCIVDLLSLGQKPLITVLVWTTFTGMMAVFFFLVTLRRPRYLWVPVVLWFAGSRLVSWAIHVLAAPMVHPSIEHGVRIAAIATLDLSMLACLFFLLFIQGEGRQALRAQTELAVAHGIQQTLVPVIDVKSEWVEIYGISTPSDKVGGDIVDVVTLSDASLFAYVSDIAGHGLPAGILMGVVKTAVRTQLFDLPAPEAVFERLAAVLPAVKEPHMYATCTALRIFGRSEVRGPYVEYAIAGQPAMLHYRAAKGTVTKLEDQQLPLGLVAGPAYRGHRIDVGAGDVLLVATDGILEAEDTRGEEFGLERLEALLAANKSEELPALAARMHAAVRAGYRQQDDQTLLLIRLVA